MDGVLVGVLFPVAVALATLVLHRIAGAGDVRRSAYAEVVAALTAWGEYPYRIRRRTSNDPEVLAGLASYGHELQERLARNSGWVHADSPTMGRLLDEVRAEMAALTAPWLEDAWNSAPISAAREMNLGAWGPRGCAEVVGRFEKHYRSRFGWRRLAMPLRALHGWVKRRREPKALSTQETTRAVAIHARTPA